MATINIGSENSDDPFHRYKMPKPVSKIEGRGNGIKTNVVNNVDIAKALERPAGYIIKYFGFELGAQTSFDVKSGTSIVNGAHDANMLMKLTESFIKTYVQCYSCGNPETVIKIRKDNIQLNCKACGHVSLVDMKHKMNNYILKNPPENKLSKEEKKLKKQEKERLGSLNKESRSPSSKKEKDKDKDKDKKKKEKSKKKKDEQAGDTGNKENDLEDPQQATSSQNPPEVQQQSDVEADEEGDDDDDEVTWSTDVSAEAIKRRAAEQLSGAVSALVTQGNIEAERKERKKRLKKEMKDIGLEDDVVDAVYDMHKLVHSPGSKAIDEALNQTSSKAAVRMQILYLALFWEVEGKLVDAVKQHLPLLESFASDSKDQLAQLVAIEFALGHAFPDRVSEVSLMLNALYEEDVIDGDLIIAWYQRPSAGEQALGVSPEAAKLVRKNVEKLVQFLEEDDDDEDDEDDEEEE